MTAPKTPAKTAAPKATPTPKSPVYEELAAPFSPDAERVLNKGGTNLTYIPVSEVIARLNRVLGVAAWSFEVVDVRRDALDPDFVIAHVRLSATLNGVTVVKDGVGGQPVKRRKSGDIVDLGDEFKGAVSDALKKAAQQLGVGLYLARDENAIDAEDTPAPPPVDPEILVKWEQFTGLVGSLSAEQRDLLNDFWTGYAAGAPKPTLARATHEDLDALIEECILLQTDAERVS